MEQVITDYIKSIKPGEVQSHKNMDVLPLFSPVTGGPRYITLKEALESKSLIVTEIDKGGSVPELRVKNISSTCILLLDGEELMGAKQNRIINTTILLKEHSETIIPVEEFRDSDVMAFKNLRRSKMRSVDESLKEKRGFRSDQAGVWENIDIQFYRSKVDSPTSAMKKIFDEKKDDINGYLEKFPCLDGQRGILVLINGRVEGLDVLSLDTAYKQLHPKLVKSYAMDAMFERKKKRNTGTEKKAWQFLEESLECKDKKYESIGYGWDHRIAGENVTGSALLHENTVIHLALFSAEETNKEQRMTGYRRRGFRR